jgi:tetratricopeptide (TPR) repeat protein
MHNSKKTIPLEAFDDLFVGNPLDIEKNLRSLLEEAQLLEDKSLYLQILSKIALTEAMQQKFADAHHTLNEAEGLLKPEYNLAQVRILLERGRVYHQSGDLDNAILFFTKSYELSKQYGFDAYAIDAAHMIAIVEPELDKKAVWNELAIDMARKSTTKQAQAWLGALYNNVAQNYIQMGRYKEALSAFEQCKQYGEERGDAIIIRGAKWGIGRSLRSLGYLNQALAIQQALLHEYEQIETHNELPHETIEIGRGMVYEELAEIHCSLGRQYAALAYKDLSKNIWFVKLEPQRLEKMKKLGE